MTAPDSGERATIPLSVPHQTGRELEALRGAIESNWLASVGPDVAAFEEEAARAIGVRAALATASGTAAIHLALRVAGVKAGDEVLVSTFTFCASVNPILYLGASPVFVDSERVSWNMDPALLEEELEHRGRNGRLPSAVIVVHLFGQTAQMDALLAICNRWNVPLIEDAAEALGASYTGAGDTARPAGTLGTMGIFSFDGSKVITTSVGGMLIADDEALVAHARKLARQAREPVDHYEHEEVGYNYRMSNLLAAVGRAQLPALADRVAARRAVFAAYEERLRDVPGISFQPTAPWGTHARWLTAILLNPADAGLDREALKAILTAQGVESRAVWKPMHQQPVYQRMGLHSVGGAVADDLFARGLCLPSSSSLRMSQVDYICDVIRRAVTHR